LEKLQRLIKMPANVYTELANTTVYTDKLQIISGDQALTYQVYATALGTAPATGNIYSRAINIPVRTVIELYSGAGNKVTVTGGGFTALELGTASSAQSGVYNAAGT
jgi:hypothetical protein